MENPLYIYHESLYNITGEEIKRPTVLIDPECDCFHGWGEYEHIEKRLSEISKAGFDMKMVELTQLPKPVTAYIILRMINYTASGFIRKFYEKSEDPNAMTWLTSEIARVPITIPDTPND